MKRRRLLGLALVAAVAACAPAREGPDADPSWPPDPPLPPEVDPPVPPDPVMPPAHPAFAAHFTDPLYNDPANEFAPFGSDEGADLLAEWDERRNELTNHTTLAEFLGARDYADIEQDLEGRPESGPVPQPGATIDAAVNVVGAAFTLLRLTGQIDPEGRRLALRALDVELAYYHSPDALVIQRRDLTRWRG